MTNWEDLKNSVAQVIRENGMQEITGDALQQVLNSIISNVGMNATYAGVATASTNPGNPDGPVFYLAGTAGTYSNFAGITLAEGESAVLKLNNGAWVKDVLPFATQEQITKQNEQITELEGKKLDKISLPLKDVEESGIYFVDEKGNAFMLYSNEKGLDVSKVSKSMADKVLAFLSLAQELGISESLAISQKAVTDAIASIDVSPVSEVMEDGAFLCNEKGEVFARFINGKFEAVGIEFPDTTVENLEDIKNVTGGTSGQFLQKQSDGNWAGANIAFPQQSMSGLIDVNVNPVEGSILQYRSGKWVNAEISEEGLVTTDSRASHPMYGKHFVCLGDSHKAIKSFLPYLAEITGAIYHTLVEKIIDGNTHIVIDDEDKGVTKSAFSYDWARYIQDYYDAEISIDYVIIENCHFGSPDKWNNAITSFPFVGFEKIVSAKKFNSYDELNNYASNSNWSNVINDLGISDIKKSIEFEYLASASQVIKFSFNDGDVLSQDTIVTIKFEDSSKIDTSLTAGMTLEECVSKINDWAFQEFSDWTNSDKGSTGITEINLSYSGDESGNPEELAVVSQSVDTNLVATVEPSVKYNKFYYVYSLPTTDGLTTKANWLAHGSSAIGWYFPNPLMGALDLLGKYYPNAKVVVCGIGNYSTAEADTVYSDGSINANAILNSSSQTQGLQSKAICKNFAETFHLQFIDIDDLCGITAYNMYPTYYDYNNVHLKEAGYHKWAECIANNIK